MTKTTLAQAALAAAFLLGACSGDLPPPRSATAAYRTPEIPAECKAAVYDDPKVNYMMRAGAASPGLRADQQDQLAFLQDQALKRCLREKGISGGGGVEPVRYKWYPSLF